jgi:lipid A 3-O-deacylase
MKKSFAAAAAAVMLVASGSVRAVDGASFEVGSGNGVDLWRAGIQWKWQKRWFEGKDWHVGGYWDLQLGQWNGASNITDISLTPTFRLQRNAGYGPYLEGAIGFHYLSGKNITAGKQFSTNFQFGDHIGAGMRFGDQGNWDLGVRFQHVSNGGIKKPNPGINFTQLRLQYHFR